jgi:hypothetical protein
MERLTRATLRCRPARPGGRFGGFWTSATGGETGEIQAAAVVAPLVEAEAVELRRFGSETLMLIEFVNCRSLLIVSPSGQRPPIARAAAG